MSINFKYFGVVLLGLMLVSFVSKGQENQKPRNSIAKRVVGKAPLIDGKLDDKAWSEAAWSQNFVQFDPFNGKKPSQKTVFKVLYDDNNLYIAIRCYDNEPGKIVKRLSRRDHIDGDWAGVAIDSHFDKRTAFGFIVSAAGVKFDGKFANDNGNIDDTWNPVWYVKTSKDSEGWVAEMKIPFSQLRFANKPNMVWGLEAVRYIFRNQEQDFWQPIAKDASGFVSKYGLLTGINNIKPKKEIAFTPYVMSKLETAPSIQGDPFASGKSGAYSVGLDGTVAVTNDLTMNFTINPDFGQVDADPSQVNLTAFETYFSEQRPFFVAGSNIFNFPLIAGNDNSQENLFYSRRIGRPPQYYPGLADSEYVKMPNVTKILGAFKLSGKTKGGWSIGAMDALGGKGIASLDSLGKRSKIAVEPLTNYFNARVEKDFKNGNTILGGMLTATNRIIKDTTLLFLPSAAYTGGIDFQNYWKDHTFRLSAKILTSSVQGNTKAITGLQEAPQRYYQRPGSIRSLDTNLRVLQGTSGSVEFAKIGKGHWRYGIQAYMTSPGLSLNDQGYIRVSDVIQETTWLEYSIWEPFSIFRSIGYQVSQWSGWNFSGDHTQSGESFSSWGQFKNYWYANVNISRNGFNLDCNELRGGPAVLKPGGWNYHVGLSTDSRKKLHFNFYINQSLGDQKERHSVSLGTGITYQPTDFLQLSLSPNFHQSYDGLIYVSTENIDNKTEYLVSGITQNQWSADIRINFSFTPDLTLEYWGQPFLYSANYEGFKRLSHPNLKKFDDQFYTYSNSQIQYDATNNQYLIHDPLNGSSVITLDNPNFTDVEFRSNMVLRWEFVPGSTLYLVWSQSNGNFTSTSSSNLGNDLKGLLSIKPTNVFLVKFSYRINM